MIIKLLALVIFPTDPLVPLCGNCWVSDLTGCISIKCHIIQCRWNYGTITFFVYHLQHAFVLIFGGETFHRILNDQEIHNWTERIKEKITCSSTIELEVLIQPKFHLDKEQKNLLQENDKEESSFFDVDDISKVEDGARLSYCNFW